MSPEGCLAWGQVQQTLVSEPEGPFPGAGAEAVGGPPPPGQVTGAGAPNVVHTLALPLPLLKSMAVLDSWGYWENKRKSDHNKLRPGQATELPSGAAFFFYIM